MFYRALISASVIGLCACQTGTANLRTLRTTFAKARFTDTIALAKGCEIAESLLTKPLGPSDRLEVIRKYIYCKDALGQLASLDNWARQLEPAGHASYARGMLALAANPGDITAAEPHLQRAAKQIGSASQEPRYRIGLLYLADGRPEVAEKHLRSICQSSTVAAHHIAFARTLAELGHTLAARKQLMRAAKLQPTASDRRRARSVVRALRRHQPRLSEEAEDRLAQGRSLITRGLAAAALGKIRDVAVAHPQNARAQRLLGLALVAENRKAEAFAAFKKARDLMPEHAANYIYMGLLYQQSGRAAAAIPLLQSGLARDPFSARAALALGAALQQSGRVAEAAAAYDHATGVSPATPPKALRRAARAYRAAKKLDLAIKRFTELSRLVPRDYEAHLRLAEMHLQLYRRSKSKRALERGRTHIARAAEISPKRPEVTRLQQQLQHPDRP